jgi:hypothetical protein
MGSIDDAQGPPEDCFCKNAPETRLCQTGDLEKWMLLQSFIE